MKGLLLKDFYTLLKQAKLFVFIIVIFALIPGFSFTAFAIIYSAMMPITALAYDERSGWDRLAAMMPYKTENLVFEKYLMGYISIGASAVLCLVIQFLYHIIMGGEWGADAVWQVLLFACVATLMLAVNLPFMFKIGVEKGRLAFLVLTMAVVLVVMSLREQIPMLLSAMEPSLAVPMIVLATAVINVISIMISMGIYRKKKD